MLHSKRSFRIMWMSKELFLLLFVGGVFGWDKYRVVQENITVNYFDPKYADVAYVVHKVNETTNALYGNFTLKFDIPRNLKYYAAAYKWVHNDYSLNFFHMEKTVQAFAAMDSFGLADLCLKHTKPPLVWPLKKGVTYRTAGWSPDSSKYPPNAPSGKWKTRAYLYFSNKTKVMDLSWFFAIIY